MIALFFLAAFTPSVDLVNVLLVPDRAAEHADAIVVPGTGGVAPGGALTDPSLRMTAEGIMLFQQGWGPLLVLSGGPGGRRRAEADVRADFARQSGVPAAAIMTLSTGRTTREEAVAVRDLLAPRGVHRILLVVEGPGWLRATTTFTRVGFEVVPSPSKTTVEIDRPPDDRLHSLRALTMELVALVYYRLVGYL